MTALVTFCPFSLFSWLFTWYNGEHHKNGARGVSPPGATMLGKEHSMISIPQPTASYRVGDFLDAHTPDWPYPQCVYHIRDADVSVYVGRSNDPHYRLRMHRYHGTLLGWELRDNPAAEDWTIDLYTPVACLPVVRAVLSPDTVRTFLLNLEPARWEGIIGDAEDALMRVLRPRLNRMGAWREPYKPGRKIEPVVLKDRKPRPRRT
jgi:hypothetical protein